MQTYNEENSSTLSVVIPIYNEEEVVGDTITLLMDTLSEKNLNYEVIIVNDGSTDGTKEVLSGLTNQYSTLRIITHPYNKGNGAAVKSGILAACGDWIVCMDGDGQHNPNDILKIIPYMGNYDLIVGARPTGKQTIWYREFANNVFNGLASSLTDFKIEDLTSGFRAFRASVISNYVHLFPLKFSYPTTSTLALLKGGHSVKYVPIEISHRKGGSSKIKILKDGWRFIMIILKIILLFEPLRVFLPISISSLLLAILSSVYGSIIRGSLYITNSSIVLFVFCLLTFMLGLISEQITALQLSLLEMRKMQITRQGE